MSILIDNFSLGIEEWVATANLSYFSVDVVDHDHFVSTSGTYFIHDGDVVSTTYSGITGGYRFFYSPSSVVSSGTITLTIHAENNNGDFGEQSYYLLYGYNVAFNKLVDWGPHQEVVTTIEATNEVFCSNTVTDAFYFETRDLEALNLSASIRAIESVDLGAVIYPQNTFFFYGRTYTITVTGVKDYNGNEMPPYDLVFTIEDPS